MTSNENAAHTLFGTPRAVSRGLADLGDHLTLEEILDYGFGRMSSDEMDEIDEHILICESCLKDIENTVNILQPWLEEIDLPDGLLDDLAMRLADPLWNTQLSAAHIVASIGSAAATPTIEGAVERLLSHQNPALRDTARRIVDRFYFATEAARPLKHEYFSAEASDAVRRCVRLYATTPERLADLAPVLSTGSDVERVVATHLVEVLGAAAAEPQFLDSLCALVTEEDYEVQLAAIEAMASIGPAATLPTVLATLLTTIQTGELESREAAIRAVGTLGPTACTNEIRDALWHAIGDQSPLIKKATAWTIGRLKEVISPDMDMVFEVMRDNKNDVVRRALFPFLARVFHSIEGHASIARDRLVTLVKTIPAMAATPIVPSAVLGGESSRELPTGSLHDGQIRYAFRRDKRNREIVVDFDSDIMALEHALIVVGARPTEEALERDFIATAHRMMWFVTLENRDGTHLVGRVRVPESELAPAPSLSELTVRVVT